MLRLIHLAAVCGTLAVAVIGSTRAAAEDFRVDTEVFNGDEKEPFAESLTLFAGGRVYDFLLNEPQEITITRAMRADGGLIVGSIGGP